jgi:hypothetical protein
MIKRKEFKPSEEAEKIRAEVDEEEEEIIELEEVVEEPDLLPVGEDLDELLKDADHDDFEFDLEKLDAELGEEVSEKALKEETAEVVEDVAAEVEDFDIGDDLDITESASLSEPEKVSSVKPSTPPSPASAQDAIDSLFQEALLEAQPAVSERKTEKLAEPVKPLAPETLSPTEVRISRDELDKAIEELENRIMSKFEAFVQNQLPLIVLQSVRDELKSLLKELEEQ